MVCANKAVSIGFWMAMAPNFYDHFAASNLTIEFILMLLNGMLV